jgi:DNA-binding CsgD family transcriptional regulator
MTATISDCPPGRRTGTPRPAGLRPAGLGPMRGRPAEQRMVGALLRRTEQGRGGVLLVDGEQGIGKSLLLRECEREAEARGFSLATGAADPLGQTIPFFALLTALRQPLTGSGNLPDDPGDVISCRIGELQATLIKQAAVAPVLVSLDDLQWASQSTLLALRVLPGQLATYPVAWILARSDMRAAGSNADLLFQVLERDGATRLALAPLGSEAVTGLLTEAFGAPPDERLLALAAGAGGNPSVLTELVAGLTDEKTVQVTGGQASMVSTGLPSRIRDVARHRLDGLSGKAQHLLKTAAVLGGSFRLADVAEMLGETPAGLLPPIEETLTAGIVVADDAAFSFRHPLLGRAAGDMIPRPARSALHRQFGEILLRRGEPAAAVAGHLLEAASTGDRASLAGLDKAAAELLPSSPQVAARLAWRALDLTHPDDPGALSRSVAAAEALTAAGRLEQATRIAAQGLAQPVPPVAEARLRCALSSILCASSQPEKARAQAEAALAQPSLPAGLRDEGLTAQLQALAGSPGHEAAERIAAGILTVPGQHNSQAITAALFTRALIAWDKGRVSEGLEFLHEAARRGRAVSADARHVQPLLALGASLADLGRYGEAEKVTASIDRKTLRGIPAQAVLSILDARLCLARGSLGQATSAAHAAVAAAGTACSYASLGHGLLALIALSQNDLAAATHHLASEPAPIPHPVSVYARSVASMTRARVAEAREGPAAAIRHIRAVCADLPHRPGVLLGEPGIPAWLVRTALGAGDHSLAADVVRAATALARVNPDVPAVTAAAAHCFGLLNDDPARLADAVAQHTDLWAQASAAEDLGVLLASQAAAVQASKGQASKGQASKGQAVGHLNQAMEGYARAGAATDMARIRRRLRGLGVRRRYWAVCADRPVTGWKSLTDAERATSELAAQGLNNRQIGGRLYISRHTVAFHLRQVFRKLQISSRVELTRVVMEQGRPQ